MSEGPFQILLVPGSSGGGGGASILVESGSAAKESGFPDAASPMGSSDRVTGLQGGANVNFSQIRIWTAAPFTTLYMQGAYQQVVGIKGGNAPASSNAQGGDIKIYAGAGDGTGMGGVIEIKAGSGGANQDGQMAEMWGGRGGGASNVGGTLFLYGGPGAAPSGSGGNILVMGGFGYGIGKVSGDAMISAGYANNGSTYGNVKFLNMKTSDPSTPNAVFFNHDVMMRSGVGNANGAYTLAGIGTKTITIVNGIITSIA